MRLHKVFGDCQSQPHTAFGTRTVGFIEAFEDTFCVFRWNADTGVFTDDGHFLASYIGRDADRAIWGENLIALWIKFVTTCWMRSASASTWGRSCGRSIKISRPLRSA